jgi:SAM-dependent methyltransferase
MSNRYYDPSVFTVRSEAEARAIILTPEAGLTTEQRWVEETEYLMSRIQLRQGGIVIDFGCGSGRMAQRLVRSHIVIGVDISQSMRTIATASVADDDFCAVSRTVLYAMVEVGFRASGAIAIWVLQHAMRPDHDVDLLADALVPGARLWVLNRDTRYVPTSAPGYGGFAWADDGLRVDTILETRFERVSSEEMPPRLCHPGAFLTRWVRK